MKDLKESNPIEVSEYAVANKIDHEPAFAWWVPDTLRKRNRIIKAVKQRALKRNYTFFATRFLKTHTTRRFYFTSVLGLRARL